MSDKTLFAIFLVLLCLAAGTFFFLRVFSSPKGSKESLGNGTNQSDVTPAIGKTFQNEADSTPRVQKLDRLLVSGFPDFPVFAGSEVIESSMRFPPQDEDDDFYAKWQVVGDFPTVSQWYLDNLDPNRWSVKKVEKISATKIKAQIDQDVFMHGYLEISQDGQYINTAAHLHHILVVPDNR